MKYKNLAVICGVIVFAVAVIGFVSLKRPEADRVVGIIITRGSNAAGHVYVNQLPHYPEEFSFFDAFGIADGVAYFIVASDLRDDGSGWVGYYESDAAAVDRELPFHVSPLASRRGSGVPFTINKDMAVYVAPTHGTFNFITVLQDANGRIFAGSSIGIGSSWQHEGEVHSFVIGDNYGAINVSLNIMYEPTRIVVAQMSRSFYVLNISEYAPDTLPDLYTLDDDTAYLIVETHRLSPGGEERISVDFYNRVDSPGHITTLLLQPNGVFHRHFSRIMVN
ncbi:MAG: hypothetical protein FWE42_04840 [Defluviitaleaceae bacterium]|nr:hypothetical protein [Defluviitaleaceae bacterium]